MTRHLWKPLLLLALVLGSYVTVTSWPRIADVETGRTPEYPDLRRREYVAAQSSVAKAARATVERLHSWRFVGEGRGPGGIEIQAVARAGVLPLKSDVTIRLWREAGMTRVSVRSKSRIGPWDFGQNARNIRRFLKELDREMFVP